METKITDSSSKAFYDAYAEDYFEQTVRTEMDEAYKRFLCHLSPSSSIVDLGSGSGRDLAYFTQHGFVATGVDESERLCALARAYSGCRVLCCSFQSWIPHEKYAGIWANASLLHLTPEELVCFWRRVPNALVENGVIFFSMKKGITTGNDNLGRYFTNFDERLAKIMFEATPNLQVIDYWESDDKMQRNDFKWVNYICRKIRR
ncbi:MAG: class I SAM-dependent methyltransferase [Candidatus Fimisoma sp.]|nr:class I SAM-dependent methyltransferase [Candidatus Fimisoma sp.]